MYCSKGSAVVELLDEDIDESSSIQCKEGTEDSSSSSEEVEEEALLSLDKAPLLSLLLYSMKSQPNCDGNSPSTPLETWEGSKNASTALELVFMATVMGVEAE